jgi:hypothetical protein
MTDKVTALRSADDEVQAEDGKRVDAFDDLFADYLAASADIMRPDPNGLDPKKSDAILDRQSNRISELFQKLACTPAPLSRHIELKFQALFAEIGDDDLHRGYRLMLESIRADVQGF